MSLLTTIRSAAESLSTFEQAISTIQSNVTNASVPNYTAQTPALASSWAGVTVKGNVDARDAYSERAVWDANQNLGNASAQANNLTLIQAQFDVTGQAGIPGALSQLYSSFSAWSTNASDPTARNQVLVAAQQLAQSFNKASATLQQSSQQLDSQISNTVDSINSLSSGIAGINQQIQNNGGSNPAMQADLYDKLQSLSQYAAVSVHIEQNGTATVLLNGQVPLVVGAKASPLKVGYPGAASPTYPTAPRSVQITANNGQDVTTSAMQGGQLAGLIQVRNSTIPSILGDQTQQGSLNQLAQAVADRVNNLLTNGQVSAGPPAVAGTALFTYDATSPTGVASSLAINSAITPSDLAAIQPGPPPVANGVANQLAGLADSSDPADQINGSTYTDFYSRITSNVGSLAASAQSNKTILTDQFTQAENLRSDISGISLNEQAALLMQYQQAYQASSQLISVGQWPDQHPDEYGSVGLDQRLRLRTSHA